jgi:serine/threonine-protein kinase RsbW
VNAPLPSTEHIGTVELRIPSKAEWVAVARLAVAAVGNRLPFSVEEIEDLKLAIAEACTNAIQHAVGNEFIDIICEAMPEQLRVTVRDRGVGTSPESIKSRRIADARVGGLGVFLIRSLMDDVQYTVDPGAGTQLVMTKRVSS